MTARTSNADEQSLTLICESCGMVFGPADARAIDILGPGYARYECPACGWVVRSVPPSIAVSLADESLIPAIVPMDDESSESRCE